GVDVAGEHDLARAAAEVGQAERLALRLLTGLRPEPDHPVALARGVGRNPAPLGDVAVESGDGDAGARAVEAPAVVPALEGAAVDAAHRQRCVPVRAPVEEHAGATA